MTEHASEAKAEAPEPLPYAKKMPLADLLREYRDGDEHGWETEFDYLRTEHSGAIQLLRFDVAQRGILHPILLGEDGRVWDGHHRLCVADLLGLEVVPVVFAGDIARYGATGVSRDDARTFLDACRRDAMAHDGLVSVNRVRSLLADADIDPRRLSAFWSHFTGKGRPMVRAEGWEVCTGSTSGNDGRPFRLRRWVGEAS